MEINLFHFSAAKNLAEIQKLNEAFRASTGWSDFLNKARQISGEFNETWLRSEYDTAYLTAESSANYFSLLSIKDVYPFWQYITVNDGKVREEHLKIHGLVLLATDRLWDKIWPPNGWNCRCRVVPLIKSQAAGIDLAKEHARVEEFFKTAEWKKSAAQGFGVNRALTGNVFEANQMYIRKFPTKAASYLDKLTAEKWGLDNIAKLMSAAKSEITAFARTSSDIWKEQSKNGLLDLDLYNDRKIAMSEKDFKKLVAKTGRLKLWNALKETLINPDEIWLNDDGSSLFDNFSLIRYYKETAVVTNYKVEKGKMVLKLWEEMKPAKAIRDTKRRGLLIIKNGNI
jgi:SPP1 gp7 family putative phage head morphogenesis protein